MGYKTKRFLASLFVAVIVALALITSSAWSNVKSTSQVCTQGCDEATTCACFGGFPAGWWNSDCYGEGGGYEQSARGCPCGNLSFGLIKLKTDKE